jgi:hypothetical protein
VNGDSHAAAAEAVNPHAFAEDDIDYISLERQPHPENIEVSWAKQLSITVNAQLHLAAESASSNARISSFTSWITSSSGSSYYCYCSNNCFYKHKND